MAASTRADILATARELFTRYGYHHVSMRSISDAMGISVGNLTYHFPRKADLADALLEQELQRVLVPPRPGLDALDQCLRGMLVSLLDNARLFSDTAIFLSIPALAHGHRDRVPGCGPCCGPCFRPRPMPACWTLENKGPQPWTTSPTF